MPPTPAPENNIRIKKPAWLKRRLPSGPQYEQVRKLIAKGSLHTVCQEAKCPNQFECFSRQTATFLILGDRCTRNCGFCAVNDGPPTPPDSKEPERVARAAGQMNLKYVVVTSVTRDDLPDGGAALFAQTIRALKQRIKGVRVEVLIPDFQGDAAALQTVLEAGPDVLNHNIETVPRLYATVRPQADYKRSLELLHRASQSPSHIPVKSGLMLGLGEQDAEIAQTLQDLHRAGCRLLTLGQYLQPGRRNLAVQRFVPPEEFEQWRCKALTIGFSEVASGPFVRSSYHAHTTYQALADKA